MLSNKRPKSKTFREYPILSVELHPTKNQGWTKYGKSIDVLDLACGTNKKLNWKCSTCEHEWGARGNSRLGGNGCPACANRVINNYDGRNSMEYTHPKLAIEYQGDATKVIATGKRRLPWKCSTCEHEWLAQSSNRASLGSGCPSCFGHLHSDGRNSMANTHPELAIEYQGDASKIIAGTDMKLDWKCSTCEHEWSTRGGKRVNGTGCPACFGHLHSDGRNSMANTHPELAIEYQGDASKIIAGTDMKLDWKCSTCEHEWRVMGYTRSHAGARCPVCCNREVHSDGRNSMATTHPKLMAEYQGDASKIVVGTRTKLDWKCSVCEHEWKATGGSRMGGKGCPACAQFGYDPLKIGYVYILLYHDEINHWLKCGITNCPKDRFYNLSRNATKVNIEVQPLNIFKFDDGYLPIPCERELKDSKDIRFESGHDINGKTEFFRYDALDQIKEVINRYCPK